MGLAGLKQAERSHEEAGAWGLALSLDTSSITVAFSSAPYPRELRTIFRQTGQRCPRGTFSLTGSGEFRLPLLSAASMPLDTGDSHEGAHP